MKAILIHYHYRSKPPPIRPAETSGSGSIPNGHECGHGLETQRNTLSQEEPANKGHKMLLPSFPFLLDRQALPSKSRNYLITYPSLHANLENLQVGFDEQLKIHQTIQ